MRKLIFKYFDEHKAIERRMQRYLLMSDDSGLQATLFLLLKLSDDEIKGIKTCIEAAARVVSLQQTQNISQQDIVNLPSSSSQTDRYLGNQVASGSPPAQSSLNSDTLEKQVSQQTSKILSKMKSDPLWALDKEFKNSTWFKKNSQLLIESIDHLLSDMSFSQTTIRLAILLLANINALNKASGPPKSYLRNPMTIEKLEMLLENFQSNEDET